MKKVLITYGLLEHKKRELESLGYEVYIEREKDIVFKPYMEDIDILMCYNPFDKIDIDKLKNLKWIQLSSMGFDQLPREKIIGRDIIITNNKGGYSIPMGEWLVLNMLELIKRRTYCYRNKEKKKWYMDFKIGEIYGKTIGFIGTGDVAREGARRLQGFNVEILGVNTDGRDVEFFNKCYNMEHIKVVIKNSDIVVITLPYTKETHHLFNEELFSLMRKGAYLINISRGWIIDEEALINNLKKGQLGGAALDVFEEEPLPQSSDLWDLENVVITCHNSWISENIDERRWSLYIENLIRYLKEETLINVVNISKGY